MLLIVLQIVLENMREVTTPILNSFLHRAHAIIKVSERIPKGIKDITSWMLPQTLQKYLEMTDQKVLKRENKRVKVRGSCPKKYIRTKRGNKIMSTTNVGLPRMAGGVKAMTTSLDTSNWTSKRIDDRTSRYDTDSFLIGIDNHASYCMTNNITDFIGTPTKVRVRVKGISGKLQAGHKGTVRWKIEDDQGVKHTLDIPDTFFIKELPIRLLSPQHLAQTLESSEVTEDGTICETFARKVVLKWQDRQNVRTVNLNQNNVAVIRSAPSIRSYLAFEEPLQSQAKEPRVFQTHVIPPDDEDRTVTETATGSDDEEDIILSVETAGHPPATNGQTPEQTTGQNPGTSFDTNVRVSLPVVEDEVHTDLERPSDELLLWHYRLGHKSFNTLQRMAACGDLPSRLAKCRVPQCAACQFGRATKVPWRTKGESNKRKIRTTTAAGQCVSVDQMESTTPGLIAQLKGRATRNRYLYATVFVDHFSRFTFVYLQKTLTSDETVKAKKAFEAYSRTLNVRIYHYHADNGRFADNGFIKACQEEGQGISYCGVNAHWQNGICEKRIRDLPEAARTQIIHAQHRWPNAIDAHLWPYALRYATAIDNATPNRTTGESPIERFAQSSVKPKLRHYHPFGCPVYVLRNELQGGQSLPRWESRARVGVYLGPSPRHARSVALILNLETGMVSPQYHVRFDNLFETVADVDRQVQSKWQDKCHFRGTSAKPKKDRRKTDATTAPSRREDNLPLEAEARANPEENEPSDEDFAQDDGHGDDDGDPEVEPILADDDTAPGQQPIDTEMPDEPPAVTTRSGRKVKPTRRATESQEQRRHGFVAYEALAQDMYSEEDKMMELDDPIAFKASSDPDTMYHHEAMKEPDSRQFREAMAKEVNDHSERKHWRPRLKRDVPPDIKILPSVWAMKRKRRIATREVYKWKARLNLGGHKQRLDTDTYAPALDWTIIRLFLILSILFSWKTRQIDFVLAYPQAPIPRETYMELPRGINMPGLDRNKHCLELLQNMYGGKDAGRAWFRHLKKGLESIGFTQSRTQDCVFFRGTTTFIVYTDDGIIFDPEDSKIDKLIEDMKEIFDVQDEGSLEDYLGVQVKHHDDGAFELTQPHLIDSILKDLNLLEENGETKSNAKGVDMPALSTKTIGPDKEGAEFTYPWEYRSLIGKLNFLEKSTRCDISFPTHQCARFMSNPRQSHGVAIKRIGRYLLKTREKGLFIRPNRKASFECYVDASFLGDWDKRIAEEDPDTAKSRTGFVVKYADVPIFWQSKMQTQFALSTAESEYLALSAATRYTRSVMYLMDELQERGMKVATTPKVYCKLFEDNSAALEMARVPKMRPRTRHINCVYHHFRNEVSNGRLIILPVSTLLQQADMLTKQCTMALFVKHRKAIMGW